MNRKNKRITYLCELGLIFQDFIKAYSANIALEHSQETLANQLRLAEQNNAWFTKKNILFALQSWAHLLEESNIRSWLTGYKFSDNEPKDVGIIMAGNIPMVGFHDFICTYLCGHNMHIKLSSNDPYLLPVIVRILESMDQSLIGQVNFVEDQLKDLDAIIATGSNNTARYFEYYFKNIPSIIRKNRNSVAILNGTESVKELQNLGEDIFRFYGLGCRNVSKIFVPKSYDFNPFFSAIYDWHPIINESKYANNYDYNKAVYLMSEFDLLENGFIMLKMDKKYQSPIATLFYEYYDSADSLKKILLDHREEIQCVVANQFMESEIPFGSTQSPKLWDYADGVDTVNFLLKI